jgi:glycerol uptake facilitator-like aquaporin
VGVSLVFGLIIMVMIYATGHLSGAHINPAVTLAFTLTRHFAPREAAAYIAAQLAGATTGALLLMAVWTDTPADLRATVPSVAAGSAVVYELGLTAFLMFVIISWPPTPARSAPPRRSPSAAPSVSTRSSAARSLGPR